VRIFSCFCIVAVLQSSAFAATIVFTAVRDNTLYEDAQGDLSNGAGQFIFAGRTSSAAGFALRRALLAFDLSDIPPGSIITDVTLSLFLSRSSPNPAAVNISLHVASKDWGEGNSDAFGEEGPGTLAQPGDATWRHTFFNTAQWTVPGGDFRVAASAVTAVDIVNRTYLWTGGSLVADVQAWLDDPTKNFGWLVRGNEAVNESAQRFNSSESSSNRPQLTVTYTIPEPSSLALIAVGTLISLRRRPPLLET
jgi:hypothetical protein